MFLSILSSKWYKIGGGFENVGLLTVKFNPKYTQKLQGR